VQQQLAVKKSSWGLGTFLVEAAKADDLITGTHSKYHATVKIMLSIDRIRRGDNL
jgi:phosphotransacetylase